MKRLSVGEETLSLHLREHGIPFEREVCLVSGRKWRWDFVVEDLAIERWDFMIIYIYDLE
jgi:hypothetical protein